MLPETDFELVEEILDTEKKDDKNIRLCQTCGYPLDQDETLVCEVCKEDERKDWN